MSMISIQYAPTFVRMYKGCSRLLQEEIKEKIALFRDKKNHKVLKVHKLNGELRDSYAFSVNYQIRIIFEYENRSTVNLLVIGNHDSAYR